MLVVIIYLQEAVPPPPPPLREGGSVKGVGSLQEGTLSHLPCRAWTSRTEEGGDGSTITGGRQKTNGKISQREEMNDLRSI